MVEVLAGLRAGASRAARGVVDALYPPVCPACDAPVAEAGGLCAACFAATALIAPPRCDRCGAPAAAALCGQCAEAPPRWTRGRAAALYDGPARRLALRLKHGGRMDAAETAAALMVPATAPLARDADLIAPAPLHWTRRAARRFNQSAEIARALARRLDRPCAPGLLRRVRATPSQDGRTRAGRRANVAGAFAVARAWRARLPGKRVLLIDDVMTTGATLDACAAALLEAGAADVDVAALARVAREADGHM